MAESISFERFAARYDATRGGLERGRQLAEALAPHVVGERILECGVGTGVVAVAMGDLGHEVLGVDLSPAMMASAQARIGSRVAAADASRLPLPSAAVDTVYFVWVLHLVGDLAAVLAESRRVLRPGGRIITIGAGPVMRRDELEEAVDFSALLGPRRDDIEHLRRAAGRADLAITDEHLTPDDESEEAPAELADRLEQRSYSALWAMANEEFTRRIVPAIQRLRSLPEPARQRTRSKRHRLVVLAPQ